jgi:hypothetical protein
VKLSIEIAGDQVTSLRDGAPVQSVALGTFLSMLLGRAEYSPLTDAIPNGVRFIRSRGDAVALVIEELPQVRTVQWLTDNSPAPFGEKAVYRTARLAFPFVVIAVVFTQRELSGFHQCFYRTRPLESWADELLLPNLYNVARTDQQPCWLCLVKLRNRLRRLPWQQKVAEIRKHMWGAGFNRSSEVHEGNSYWTAAAKTDQRVATLDRWETESANDPFFALKVPWHAAGLTIGGVVDGMLTQVQPGRCPATVSELAALVGLASANSSIRPPAKLPLLVEKLAAFSGMK